MNTDLPIPPVPYRVSEVGRPPPPHTPPPPPDPPLDPWDEVVPPNTEFRPPLAKDWTFRHLARYLTIAFGTWKLVEILVWAFSHVEITLK